MMYVTLTNALFPFMEIQIMRGSGHSTVTITIIDKTKPELKVTMMTMQVSREALRRAVELV